MRVVYMSIEWHPEYNRCDENKNSETQKIIKLLKILGTNLPATETLL